MNTTDQLREEHEGIMVVLRVLTRICALLQSGRDVDTDDIGGIIQFLKVFADRCHHAKEEDVLFPALEEAGIPREGGPVGVMLSEHVHGREYIAGMDDAARAYAKGDKGAVPLFVDNAKGYIDLLTAHIQKENTVLFPMADRALPPQKQEQLNAACDRIETERIGQGKHEEFHAMIERWEESYLGAPQSAGAFGGPAKKQD